MAYQLNITGDELKKAVNLRVTPPTQDIVNGNYTDAAPLAVTAGTEYRLTFDDTNLARNFTNGFNTNTGITTMYDFTEDVAIYSDFVDTPTIVALPNLYFKPTAANAGECIIRMYVNETSPIQHDQATVSYQGAIYDKMGDLFSYYLGDEVGYQIKSKGIYFTFEFSHDGDVKDMGLFHYLT